MPFTDIKLRLSLYDFLRLTVKISTPVVGPERGSQFYFDSYLSAIIAREYAVQNFGCKCTSPVFYFNKEHWCFICSKVEPGDLAESPEMAQERDARVKEFFRSVEANEDSFEGKSRQH